MELFVDILGVLAVGMLALIVVIQLLLRRPKKLTKVLVIILIIFAIGYQVWEKFRDFNKRNSHEDELCHKDSVIVSLESAIVNLQNTIRNLQNKKPVTLSNTSKLNINPGNTIIYGPNSFEGTKIPVRMQTKDGFIDFKLDSNGILQPVKPQ